MFVSFFFFFFINPFLITKPFFFFFFQNKKLTKHSTAKPNKYTAAELRLMRTQDVRYLAARATHEARAAERLARSLHGIGAVDGGSKPPASHVVFVDSASDVRRFSAEEHFGTPKELLGRAYNRPRVVLSKGEGGGGQHPSPPAPLVAFPAGERPDRAAMRADRRRAASYAELERRRRRASKLLELESAMRRTQALSGKGRVRRLSPAEVLRQTGGRSDGRGKGKVYKFAKVRKR